MRLELLLTLVLASTSRAQPPADGPHAHFASQLTAEELFSDPALAAFTPDDLASFLPFLPPPTYAPKPTTCPTPGSTEWVWQANKLSDGEVEFRRKRAVRVEKAVETVMKGLGMEVPPRAPVLGYAISGGGYRSMLTGLGGLMALMHYPESQQAGTAGWYDALTYMAGLSGGAWGTSSFLSNGGMSPLDLIEKIWNLDKSLILPPNSPFYYPALFSQVSSKKAAGFPTQLTDWWGLALGEHLLPERLRMAAGGKADASISGLRKVLGEGEMPMPILVASQREEGEYVIATNATLWEFTPWSFGSWAFGSKSKVPGGFTPVEYLGTKMVDGVQSGKCWKGFDRLGFIMGTSSTLFNGGFLQLRETTSNGLILKALNATLFGLGKDNIDVARVPNPFYKWSKQENPLSNLPLLTLVDAGETGQNLPLEPLLTPERRLDAIIAFDASANTPLNWPNGSSVYTTFTRAVILAEKDDTQIKMPRVPTAEEFVKGGMNRRPTFFGCGDRTTPVVVYVPQTPWTYYSNHSTWRLTYPATTARSTLLNGLRSLTLNSTSPLWPQCLACALTDRAFSYTDANRTAVCQKCFTLFCWDGVGEAGREEMSLGKWDAGQGAEMGVPGWLVDKGLVQASAVPPRKDAGGEGHGWWDKMKEKAREEKEKVESGLSQGRIKDWGAGVVKGIGKIIGIGK
ncbi:hypothetical protein IAT38_008416 [Cryptococcus sp. DSM 104549]